jgi:hypothetical protein
MATVALDTLATMPQENSSRIVVVAAITILEIEWVMFSL